MRFGTTCAALMLLSALSACGKTNVVPVVARPDVPTICDVGFPHMSEEAFLAMSESEQEDLLIRQGTWLNDCLSPGQTPPPSLF